MIRVRVLCKGEFYYLRVAGHADGGIAPRQENSPMGNIVCGAVSALVETLRGYLLNRPDIKSQDSSCFGFSEIACWGDVGTAMDMTLIGLMQIRAKYPDQLEIQNL